MKEDLTTIVFRFIGIFVFAIFASMIPLCLIAFGSMIEDPNAMAIQYHILALEMIIPVCVVFFVMKTVYKNRMKEQYYLGQDNGIRIAYKAINSKKA